MITHDVSCYNMLYHDTSKQNKKQNKKKNKKKPIPSEIGFFP